MLKSSNIPVFLIFFKEKKPDFISSAESKTEEKSIPITHA